MSEQALLCTTCGEPLPSGSGDRPRCALCGTVHVVERSGGAAALRPADPQQGEKALDNAKRNLRIVQADISFLQSDMPGIGRQAWLPIAGVLFLALLGTILLAAGFHRPPEVAPGLETPEDPSSLPGYSMQEQHRIIMRVFGVLSLLASGLLIFAIPWRQWLAARRALTNARIEERQWEEVIRRVTARTGGGGG